MLLLLIVMMDAATRQEKDNICCLLGCVYDDHAGTDGTRREQAFVGVIWHWHVACAYLSKHGGNPQAREWKGTRWPLMPCRIF